MLARSTLGGSEGGAVLKVTGLVDVRAGSEFQSLEPYCPLTLSMLLRDISPCPQRQVVRFRFTGLLI